MTAAGHTLYLDMWPQGGRIEHGGINLVIKQVSVQPGPGAVLFRVGVEATPTAPAERFAESSLTLHGQVDMNGLGETGTWLGRLWQQLPARFPPAGQTVSATTELRVEIDRTAIEKIEEARNGREPQWAISLYGEARSPDGSLRTGWSSGLSLTFSVAEWAELLHHGKATDMVLLMLPTGHGPHDVVTLFRRAQRLIIDGQPKEAVARVREAAELLKNNRADLPSKPFDRTKEERYAAVAKAIWELTGGAVHTDKIPADSWTRADAQAAVGLLAALLRGW